MLKSDAIRMLGGTIASTAEACGISRQAVSLWPDVLTKDIEDRVLAALARKHLPADILSGAHEAPVYQRGDGTVVRDERHPENAGEWIPPRRRANDKPTA